MGLQNVSSGRIDAAVFLLTYAIGEIAFRRASGIGWTLDTDSSWVAEVTD